METEEREVTITLRELRIATLQMNDALRVSELTKLSNEHLALVHAYQLGVVMRATGMTPGSIPAVIEFVQIGYDDFGGISAEFKGASDD